MSSPELVLDYPTPPSLSLALSEFPRSGAEVARLLLHMRGLVKRAHPGDGHPVLTLPGYGAGDSAMALVRFYLNKIGYQAHPLKLGINFDTAEDSIHRIEEAAAFRQKMSGLVIERAQGGRPQEAIGRGTRAICHHQIGWSRGFCLTDTRR